MKKNMMQHQLQLHTYKSSSLEGNKQHGKQENSQKSLNCQCIPNIKTEQRDDPGKYRSASQTENLDTQ